MKQESPHIPVLLEEVIATFKDIKGTIVDCTLGYGGHSEALLQADENRKLICIDRDIEAIEFSKKRLAKYGDRVTFYHGRFSDIINKLQDIEIDGLLADIGVSSLQLDKKERGFGFESEVLDMRMDSGAELTAYEIVNNYSKNDLERIFREYGEVRESKTLADAVIENRPISSAKELTEICKKIIRHGKINPATLPFQAIRIEVNGELNELQNMLDSLKSVKCKRVAIISFHSLEDRIVKEQFKLWASRCICPQNIMRCECGGDNALGKIVTKKPIIPTAQEIRKNPRSRSSKMRVFDFDKGKN